MKGRCLEKDLRLCTGELANMRAEQSSNDTYLGVATND